MWVDYPAIAAEAEMKNREREFIARFCGFVERGDCWVCM
jgi:hypothetical protein